MTDPDVPTGDSAMSRTPSAKTPPRHNYANPLTPIASIKRPRSSMERTPSTRHTSLGTGTVDAEVGPLSPMHPPTTAVHLDNQEESSWVERKVDALFSPVLSFLNNSGHGEEDGPDGGELQPENEKAPESVTPVPHAAATDEDEEDYDEDDESHCESMVAMEDVTHEDDFNPWQFIKGLPPYAYVRHLCPPVTLPAKTHAAPVTLVLDLDETLVHCTVEPVDDADLTFPVQFHGTTYQVHVRLRPHLQTFLERIKDKYEVVIFTASQKVYANELLNLIDPEGKYFHHRLYRESCLNVEGNFLKDLNVLGRDLNKTVLVDNSPHAFGYQVDNGIPIESWFDDPHDRELLKLERFLRTVNPNDVQTTIRNKFQCHKLIKDAQL